MIYDLTKQGTTPDLKTRKGGYIEADPQTMRTSKPVHLAKNKL